MASTREENTQVKGKRAARRYIRRVIVLIWLGVTVSLGVVAFMASAWHQTVSEENERAYQRNMRLLADSTAKSVRLFFDGVISEIVLLTELDVVKRYSVKEVEVAFRGIVIKHEERISHLTLLDGSGRPRITLAKSGQPEIPVSMILNFFTETMPLWRVNLSSSIFMAPKFHAIGVGMPIFRKAAPGDLKTPGGHASGIFASGMVVALVTAEDLVEYLVDTVRVGKGGFAWVYTDSGDILANPGKMGAFVESVYGAGKANMFAGEFTQVMKGAPPAGWSYGENKRSLKIARDGEEWFVSLSGIEIQGRPWTVAVASPRREATALLNKSFWQLTILFVVVLLTVTLGGSVITRSMMRVMRAEERAKHTAELEKKNRDLEEMNRRMDEFVSVASHDIRSPLNVIRGFVKMIQSSPEGAVFQRETSIMLRSSNRLLQLVNDILDVSKLEAGKVRLALDPVELDAVIEESARTMEFAAREKGQTIITELGEKTVAEVDESKLMQVMNNLIGNAVKFTPSGGVVRVAKTVENGDVVILVTDTGPGIPEEEQGMVFEKFEQARRHQQGIEPGSGLGLTICKELVELHGGKISVASAAGKGSTFSIRLPVKNQGPIIREA